MLWFDWRPVETTYVRFWPLADMPHAATNVGFGGKTDITVDGPECPLMTQSGHANYTDGCLQYTSAGNVYL